jgi:anti-anti-sigma factor
MQTQLRKNGSITILDLEGHIDFESTKPFRDQCMQLMRRSGSDVAPCLLFNLGGLKFVGSSGLSSFIQILKELNKLKVKPRFCGVGSDFKKMFHVYSDGETFEIFASEDDALKSFSH